MNRLRALPGGQPLRSDDWSLIQDATAVAIKELVTGLKGISGPCVVSGLVITTDYDNSTIGVSEGTVFDGEELRFCAAMDPVEYHGWQIGDAPDPGGYSLYFAPAVTTSEERVFKDLVEREVYEQRVCELVYAQNMPAGGFIYPERLLDMITAHVIENVPPAPLPVVRYVRKSFPASSLEQWQPLIAAPGSEKAIKVISLSARIVPTVPLGVDGQVLNVFYGSDPTETGIGSFPDSVLESATELHWDMEPVHDRVYKNMNVGVGLSAEAQPTGSATIVIYCHYAIISL